MKRISNQPYNAVYWYAHKEDNLPPLHKSLSTDFVIVGGGMAGLIAAYHARKRGYEVVLLEKSFCGSGASGKSSGFITPDSEWEFSHLVKVFGLEKAILLWRFAVSGCAHIQTLIKNHSISCDYQEQQSLIVALNSRGYTHLVEEHRSQKNAGFESVWYPKDDLHKKIGSEQYSGGLAYADTFGINPFAFCTALKKILIDLGVAVFEDTRVTTIDNSSVHTSNGHTVDAKYTVVCVDRWAPELGCMRDTVSQVQTLLTMSNPLSDAHIKQIFPRGNAMVWDTGIPYTYYRVTGDNRILLGGASIITTYSSKPRWHDRRMIGALEKYWVNHFPQVPVSFEYAWPGLIGVSKDILPLAGFDCQNPNVYGIAAASGLPWAAALGAYAIERIVDARTDYDSFFSPQRPFPISNAVQKVMGKKLAFMLSHAIVEFF